MAYCLGMNQTDVRNVLAKNIKKHRKELGITQTKLAELTGISEPYMNDIERSQTWVSDKTIAKLAWALNVELYELFTQDAEPAAADKKATYRLFQQHKEALHDYIEKSFETLLRDVLH